MARMTDPLESLTKGHRDNRKGARNSGLHRKHQHQPTLASKKRHVGRPHKSTAVETTQQSSDLNIGNGSLAHPFIINDDDEPMLHSKTGPNRNASSVVGPSERPTGSTAQRKLSYLPLPASLWRDLLASVPKDVTPERATSLERESSVPSQKTSRREKNVHNTAEVQHPNVTRKRTTNLGQTSSVPSRKTSRRKKNVDNTAKIQRSDANSLKNIKDGPGRAKVKKRDNVNKARMSILNHGRAATGFSPAPQTIPVIKEEEAVVKEEDIGAILRRFTMNQPIVCHGSDGDEEAVMTKIELNEDDMWDDWDNASLADPLMPKPKQKNTPVLSYKQSKRSDGLSHSIPSVKSRSRRRRKNSIDNTFVLYDTDSDVDSEESYEDATESEESESESDQDALDDEALEDWDLEIDMD